MRKKHSIAPKIPRCSGPDSHNEQTPALKVPLQTELRFHSHGYEQPPHRRTCGTTSSGWLAADHCSSDNDLRSGRPNSSSDDLRADAAATRPSPASPLEWRGQAIKAKEPEVGPRVALMVSSVGKPSPAATTSAPTTVATCPPVVPHSSPLDGRAPTSARRRRARARAGQPKNTNATLAVRDVLGGPPVRAAQQPPVRRADSHIPPSGGRWHQKLCQSQLSQRTRHAGADDACGQSTPRCQSPPPPLGR
jgi:hypothetical protein